MEAASATRAINERSQRWAVGQRVRRLNDGAPGVITELGPRGNVWVQWEDSGLQTVINALQVESG